MPFSERIAQGRTVVASGGQTLGTVESLTIDDGTWQVEALHVKLESDAADELGTYWNYFHAARIDVPTRLVHSVSDTVILAVSVDELRQVLSQEQPAAPA
jgi:sporulation protein YlmC with PRC-barrel domain